MDTNPGRATCESIADHLVKLRHDDELRRAIKTIQQRIDEKGLDQQVATDDEIIVELSRRTGSNSRSRTRTNHWLATR